MYWKILFYSILCVLCQHSVRFLYILGLHRSLFSHSPGTCRLLHEVGGGSEDIQTLPDGLSFISSGYIPGESDSGRIYIYDLSMPDKPARPAKLSADFDSTSFWPHGIGLWHDNTTGEVILFVISHHPKGDRIEKFHFERDSETLHHITTIQDQTINRASNIIPIDSRRFYFTNMFQQPTHESQMLEAILMLSWGTLVYYDGQKGHVMNRAYIPNGIALSPDKRIVYMSASGNQELRVFRRVEGESEGEALHFVMSLPIDAHLENINVDPSGALWLAAANSMAEQWQHEQDPTMPCGSRVFRIEADKFGNLSNIREVYANDGLELSCATSASFYNGRLLIGAARRSPLVCDVHAL